MTEVLFTEEDVHLVAEAVMAYLLARTGIKDPPVIKQMALKNEARVALRALAEAGRLLLPSGEERQQFTVLEVDPEHRSGGWFAQWTLESAQAYKARLEAEIGGVEWHRRPGPFAIYRRVVRSWPDGSQWFGPWEPVDSGEAP